MNRMEGCPYHTYNLLIVLRQYIMNYFTYLYDLVYLRDLNDL
jgi:hypothetical protein